MPKLIDLSALDCVSYLRVSTESQAGEKQTSIADQDAATRELAKKLERKIGHVFKDAGLSGASIDQRPAMLSLIASCEAAPKSKRHPGFVVVLNDSRWGRFPASEEATYWRFHLEKRGWIVRFAELDDVQDDQLRPILRSINQSQASTYRRVLRANVIRGTRGQAEQGFWQAQAPFGYSRKVVFPVGRERVLDHHTPKAPDEKVVLVPNADEAPIVKAIFERYAAGTESLASLVEWMLVQCPQRKWSRPAIRFILNNPAYVGDVVWGRLPNELNEDGKKAYAAEADRYGKAEAHEPIVSRALFARAVARSALNRRRTRGVRSDWILSGIVRCRCGKPFAAGGSGGTTRTGRILPPVYRCTSRGHHRSARCQFCGTIVKRLLEDAVLSTLADVVGSLVQKGMMASAIDRANRVARKAARSVEQIDRDLKGVRDKQGRLMAAIEADAISTIEARERNTDLRRTLSALTVERERVLKAQERATLPDREREQLIALAMDFRATMKRLEGPALRELIRPWIKNAVFNTDTRELTMEIRRFASADVVLESAEYDANQKHTPEPVIKRVVRVGGRR
jgi:hypothetical protein